MNTTLQTLDSFDFNKFLSGALDHDFLIPVSLEEWEVMQATDVELDARLHELRGLEQQIIKLDWSTTKKKVTKKRVSNKFKSTTVAKSKNVHLNKNKKSKFTNETTVIRRSQVRSIEKYYLKCNKLS